MTKRESTGLMRRGSWRAGFLDAISRGVTVSKAAELMGCSRKTAYAARARSPEFAAQWDDAIEQACDALEQAALTRALVGWDEPVWGTETFFDAEGRRCSRTVQVGVVTRQSDRMIIFLLQCWRREKYGPRIKVDSVADASVIDAEIERLTAELGVRTRASSALM